MLIISDTSPVANLIVIGHLNILQELFKEVVIPSAVYSEIIKLESFSYNIAEFKAASWIVVKNVENVSLVEKLKEVVDKGEAEAIILATELKSDFILMDEKIGRQIAQKHGLKVVGLLGILLKAKEHNIVNKIKPLLDKLRNDAGFWIKEDLYLQILKIANE